MIMCIPELHKGPALVRAPLGIVPLGPPLVRPFLPVRHRHISIHSTQPFRAEKQRLTYGLEAWSRELCRQCTPHCLFDLGLFLEMLVNDDLNPSLYVLCKIQFLQRGSSRIEIHFHRPAFLSYECSFTREMFIGGCCLTFVARNRANSLEQSCKWVTKHTFRLAFL